MAKVNDLTVKVKVERVIDVTWQELIDWALKHGAKNDRIETIEIKGPGQEYPVVVCTGLELDEVGRAIVVDRDFAKWRSAARLRWLP